MKSSSRDSKKEEKPLKDPLDNELESILANRIDEDYIASVTGIKDLERIEYIALQIDTSLQSVFDLIDLLPNMKHLVLDNSVIGSIRDLGVGLRHLSSLSLSGCGLHDLDGISVLTGLQELNLSDNYISDVSPLTFHEHLQNLNLGGNKILDLNFGGVLASCTNLRSLFLSRNPIERVSKYRVVVSYIIPSLEMLDGFPVDPQLVKKFSSTIIEEATNELKLIEEEIAEEGRIENEIAYDANSSFADKKLNVSINNSITISNPAVSLTNKGSNYSANSSLNISSSELIPDTGSELTHGSAIVLAGNVAAAMRKRRNGNHSDKSTTSTAEEGKEFESALEVLDSALLPNSRSNSGKEASIRTTASTPTSSHFIKEGDITEQVLGPSSPVKRSRHHTQNSSQTTSNRTGLELNTDFITSPSTKPPLSSTKNDAMLGDPNTKLLSATRRPQSAFTGTTYRFSEKSTPTPATTADNFSPRIGSSSSRRNENGSNSAIPSPRQINSSRPQSAVNPSLFENLKFSFTTNNSSANNSAMNTARPQSSRRNSHRSQSDDSEDEDDDGPPYHQNNYRKIVPISKNNEEKQLTQQKGVSSIVHLDIVKRNNKNDRLIFPLDYSDLATTSSTPRQVETSRSTRSNSEVEEEDSDEDIAVPHHERLRLMSAAAVRPSTSTTKTQYQILQQLKSSKSSKSVNGIAIPDDSNSSQSDEDNDKEDNPQLFRKTKMSELVARNTVQEKNNTLSSQIGMSLGFNLAGSLAAIDQWVQDMSSGDDEEAEIEDLTNGKPKRTKEKKESKIQIIGVPSYNNSNDNNNKDKILSRDTIINMCTNSSNPTPRRGRSDFDESVEEGRNSRSSSRMRDSSTSRRPVSVNNDTDVSFDLPSRSATKEKPLKPAISSSKEVAVPSNKPNKLALVQKKHLTVSDHETSISSSVINTPDFEERLVTTVPLTSASTSVLFTKKGVPVTTATPSSSTLPVTAQSLNSLESLGKGTLLSNEDIIDLLKKPPKSVPMLRTKTSFQEFFKGIDRRRFESLLKEAYSDIDDLQEREKKVLRRLELMEGMM